MVTLNKRPRLLIFETHPIQYRAPIFQRLEMLRPGSFEVIYASDFSVKGYADEGFGETIRWDQPLLSGYQFRILHNDGEGGARRFLGLTARGVDRVIAEVAPSAIMLSSLGYAYSFAAYLAAFRRRIPIWYRADTNEQAFARSRFKAALRTVFYRLIYAGLSKGLYVGELNRRHFAKFGVGRTRRVHVPHCTPDRLSAWTEAQKLSGRGAVRASVGAEPDDLVVGFFGKLIAKKDPHLLLRAAEAMPPESRAHVRLLFVGAGELEAVLREDSASTQRGTGIGSHFAGFVNQGRISSFYLASDIVVLPSRRAGETWGLVVNEALQAGCGVIISEDVGCSADFGDLNRVRVIRTGDSTGLARAIDELRSYRRDFGWAAQRMAAYSVDAAAQALAVLIDSVTATAS